MAVDLSYQEQVKGSSLVILPLLGILLLIVVTQSWGKGKGVFGLVVKSLFEMPVPRFDFLSSF